MRGACRGHLQPAQDVCREALQTFSLQRAVDDLPVLPPNPRETAWATSTGRIWIQTDNEQLSSLLAGHSRLETGHLRPIFVRLARKLHTLLEKQRLPRRNTTPIVEWDLRSFNTYVDHAANCALDRQEAWTWQDDVAIARAKQAHSNIRMSFDGAHRRSSDSSGGMAVFSYDEAGGRQLLYRAGIYFGKLESAFLSETLSLEWALDILLAIIV